MEKQKLHLIERQLGQFKRKYWLAKLLQGTLVFSGTGLLFFGLIALVEYFSWLSTFQRTILFFVLLIVELALLGFYMGWPLIQLLIKGRALSDSEAARIIGQNLNGVNDRLLNYLELKSIPNNSELIDAGLWQKQNVLSKFNFKKALNYASLKPFMLFLIPIGLFLAFIISGNRWFMLEEGTNRLINFNVEYERELPFKIQVNQELAVDEGEDFELTVFVKGEVVPEQLELETTLGKSVLNRTEGNKFSYVFRKCLRNVSFRFIYDGIVSQDHLLEVKKRPVVGRVSVAVQPPSYTGLSPYEIENTSSLEVPQYSKITVNYAFKNANKLLVTRTNSRNVDTFQVSLNQQIEFKTTSNNTLIARAQEEELNRLNIDVLIDKRPVIAVLTDSLNEVLNFRISANDDYSISFAKVILKSIDGSSEDIPLPYQRALLNTSFRLVWEEIVLLESVTVVVGDNIGAAEQTIRLDRFKEKEKTKEELLNEAGAGIQEIQEELSKDESKEQLPGDKKEQLKKKAEKIKKSSDNLSKKDSNLYQRFEQLSEEILKLSEEMDKEIPESRKKMKEQKLEEMISKLEQEWMILKNIENLKRLEDSLKTTNKPVAEEQINELIKEANELEEKLKKEDQENSEKVDWEKFDEIKKKNDELNSKQKESNSDKKDNNKGEQEQQEGDNQKEEGDQEEQKEQQGGDQKMKDEMKQNSEDLRQQLGQMSDIMMMQATQANIELLRRLELRSLKSSTKQEEVYLSAIGQEEVSRDNLVSQKEVTQSAKNVLDSLSVLTVSSPELAMVLADNQRKLDEHIDGINKIDPADHRQYVSSQRYLQYGLNDLAAILYDILKQEQQNMMNMKKGNKQCNKPKPGQGKKPSMSKKQGELGEKMKAMKKKGKSKNKQSFSQGELLELIKGQEEVMEQYKQEAGKKPGKNALAEEMNKQLDDLIKGDVDKALERNKNIEDKLITFEQSENKKKEQEDKRQSKENSLDYDVIRREVVQDYLKQNQSGSSVVNLPALKNYFTGKWILINQK